jgi:hypothetical protein
MELWVSFDGMVVEVNAPRAAGNVSNAQLPSHIIMYRVRDQVGHLWQTITGMSTIIMRT